jgi:RsiW-degrading membrane proteinase PrsW (M82 family)
MSRSVPLTPVLRQIPNDSTRGGDALLYPLDGEIEVLIGRDLRCQLVLDSSSYAGVSRQHAQIVQISNTPPTWQICDLNSANGTFINDRRLQGCQVLQSGDRILLGIHGPEFRFEYQPLGATRLPGWGSGEKGRSEGAFPTSTDGVTLSQLFPIVSTGISRHSRDYWLPGLLTVAAVMLMFLAVGNSLLFNLLLASYLSGGAYYFVYRLCDKPKPWWLLVGVALFTALILASPVLNLFIVVFRGILPGDIPDASTSGNFVQVLVQMFFGAGLMEELLKALPILLCWWIGRQLRSPYREQIGVWEPLDGILLGTASAVGFTLMETLGQYVPAITSDVTFQAGTESGQLMGLQLLIPRVLGSIAGHMAYSGYLGYFIGLSALKPAKQWQILGIGYLTAAGLHALWNASGIVSFPVLAVVGVMSYAFLVAAILKARVLSPRHSIETRFTRSS